ncbi:MAG: TolC family outer membrane protein [Proteobacteria bacterium]|nr:TolC family outer membrane protein [Pseudomonadota bacterium]
MPGRHGVQEARLETRPRLPLMRRLKAAAAAALLLASPIAAHALSLDEAIALARKANPMLAQAQAQADAAAARLSQARAGRLPTVTVAGETGTGTTDLGGFFGFGHAHVAPRTAGVEIRQPLFAGGAIGASIDRAQASRAAAVVEVSGARAQLSTQVAEAYVGVQTAARLGDLAEFQVSETQEVLRQARLRFERGEAPRTDVDQATARLAQAEADRARARAEMSRARAHFVSVIGAAPEGLEPASAAPIPAQGLEQALAVAEQQSPAYRSAGLALEAAEAAVRAAEGGRLPSVALAASAATTRDKFFPGYRADDLTVVVQGRWTLFSGGLVSGQVSEARAQARAARATRDAARLQVREAVTGAWADLEAARQEVTASEQRSAAAAAALESVGHEVRVGEKPALDLLDAQRDQIAAEATLTAARAKLVTTSYRLNALVRGE